MTLSISPAPSPSAASPRDLVRTPSFLRRMGHGIRRATRAMQCARLREAMSALSDEQLAQAGLTRADIPRHAHDCIHGPS